MLFDVGCLRFRRRVGWQEPRGSCVLKGGVKPTPLHIDGYYYNVVLEWKGGVSARICGGCGETGEGLEGVGCLW